MYNWFEGTDFSFFLTFFFFSTVKKIGFFSAKRLYIPFVFFRYFFPSIFSYEFTPITSCNFLLLFRKFIRITSWSTFLYEKLLYSRVIFVYLYILVLYPTCRAALEYRMNLQFAHKAEY